MSRIETLLDYTSGDGFLRESTLRADAFLSEHGQRELIRQRVQCQPADTVNRPMDFGQLSNELIGGFEVGAQDQDLATIEEGIQPFIRFPKAS